MSRDISPQSSDETRDDRDTTPPPAGGDRTSVTADDLFRALSKATNRFTLYYLIKVDRPVSVNELIEYIVMSTEPAPADQTAGEFRGDIRAAIDGSLPKLDSLGLLRYHVQSDVVEPTRKTTIAEPYLALALEQLE